MPSVPLIDLAGDHTSVATAIDQACREHGFFCISGHGVPTELTAQLTNAANTFFDLDEHDKQLISMAVGGRAWRGWFPLGGEVTNGVPDRKEGLYFGEELAPEHPRVRAGVALHGANLFPAQVPALRDCVLAWMTEMHRVAGQVMAAVALGLGLDRHWFRDTMTREATQLLRIFRYPIDGPGEWGVAEHTDYGLLTVLLQDDCGGLQVKTSSGWRDVAPVPDTFVCNIGDMLERVTGGVYRSTAHRVRNTSGRDRLSIPYFFDPGWDVRLTTAALGDQISPAAEPRWDGRSVFDFDGTYGEYLVAKVSKVFPDLVRSNSAGVF